MQRLTTYPRHGVMRGSHPLTSPGNACTRRRTARPAQAREETYTYDENGSLEQLTDRKAQDTVYAHDALDRMTLVTFEDPSTTEYAYDSGDRLTEVDDSIAGVITRDWDGLDRLIEEDTPEGLVSYTYDDADRRASMTVDGQSTVTCTYHNANRLTDIAQSSANVDLGEVPSPGPYNAPTCWHMQNIQQSAVNRARFRRCPHARWR